MSKHPPSSGIAQTEEKNKDIFKENETDLLQPHFKTHRCMMVKLEMISCPFHAILFTVITWVKLYVPREESCPIPLKYIDVTRATHTSLDVMLEKNIDDYWNVDGDRELSDTWTGSTRFTFLKPSVGFSWSGRTLTRKQTTSRPDTLWPEIWKDMSDAPKRKEKQKWAVEKPKLDNARKLRRISFIDPDCKEFKDIMKSASRNALQNST